MRSSVEMPVLDLFAGAGGLSLGLARAGLQPVAAAEMDRDALSTYVAAHELYSRGSALELFEGDIAHHDFAKLRGQVAVVAGGPPCQPFSHGGLRLGEDDSRDGIPHFLRVVREVSPEAFIMENVPGLATGAQRLRLSALVEEFSQLGFHVDWKRLKVADYGVCQRRERLFVIGTRHPGFAWPTPTHGLLGREPAPKVKDVLSLATVLGEPNECRITYARQPDLRPSPWDGHLWNGGGRPLNPEGLAPTMLASMGGNKTPWVDTAGIVPAYHGHLLAGGAPRVGVVEGARRITTQEAALVQSFPADMPWAGRRSSQYRQIGNAVPVRLAEAVGGAVMNSLAPAARFRRAGIVL